MLTTEQLKKLKGLAEGAEKKKLQTLLERPAKALLIEWSNEVRADLQTSDNSNRAEIASGTSPIFAKYRTDSGERKGLFYPTGNGGLALLSNSAFSTLGLSTNLTAAAAAGELDRYTTNHKSSTYSLAVMELLEVYDDQPGVKDFIPAESLFPIGAGGYVIAIYGTTLRAATSFKSAEENNAEYLARVAAREREVPVQNAD